MAGATSYKAPLSGRIIGAVIKELALQNEVLKSKTAKRYFSGERVKDDSKAEIFSAIGKALVDHHIIPPSTFLEREVLPIERAISLGITCHAHQWDQLVGYMRSTSTPVDRPDLAAISYLRLAVIDLALRASAVLWLADVCTPQEGTPLWVKKRGGSKYLRQLLDKCKEGSRPTRDELAERIDVSNNTIDNWLDINTRPSWSNIRKIAEELAPLIADLDAATSPRPTKPPLHLVCSL